MINLEELEKQERRERVKAQKEAQKEANFYCDDYALTAMILKEQKDFREGKVRSASNELAKEFMTIREHVLKKRNFSGYSQNYKDEFRSKASELFVKHWHKFDATRARKNYTQKDGELYYKEDVSELRGAFGWFSLFCKTAAIDEIKRFKKGRENVKKIIDEKNSELKNMDSFLWM